jgi:hypothetical protein
LTKSKKAFGKTKAQCLKAIKTYDIANLRCSAIGSDEISAFAGELSAGRDPSTVGNYLSHLGAVFAVARPLWKYPLDRQAIRDATIALRKMGSVAKSKQRDRRPTLAELDQLMTHFGRIRADRPSSNPMQAIIAFAIFSTRREDEITRITWADLDEEGSREGAEANESHDYARQCLARRRMRIADRLVAPRDSADDGPIVRYGQTSGQLVLVWLVVETPIDAAQNL